MPFPILLHINATQSDKRHGMSAGHGEMSPGIRLCRCNSKVRSTKHTHELSEKEKVSVRDSMPGKMRSLLTVSYQAMTEDTQFQGWHQEHSALWNASCWRSKVLWNHTHS